jgi:hypothetical protein
MFHKEELLLEEKMVYMKESTQHMTDNMDNHKKTSITPILRRLALCIYM